MTNDIGKVPPYNRHAEQSVLGAMLFDERAIGQVIENGVQRDWFYIEAHRQIYEAILSLYDVSTPIDLVSVSEKLRKNDALEAVGGAVYLSELLDLVPTIAHVDYYCKLVKEKWFLRELHEGAIETITDINDPTLDIEDVLDSAERRTLTLTERRVSGAMRPTSAIMPATTDWLRDLYDNPRDVTGLPTGFTKIDLLMRGMQKKDLIIIAGRPSMGKSSLAINIAQNAAIREGASVAIFSLEMGGQEIMTRMICSEADTQDITLKGLQTGYYGPTVVPSIEDAAAIIAKAKIYIDESNGISSMAIKAKSRLLKARDGLDLIIIDYLQLMEEKRGRNDNREQEIATISRRLKALAKELDIPVIALSQLNRAAERREIERPRLADLRESGAIEQDADVVLMLYRAEYYYQLRNPTAERMPEDMRNKAEVIIAKQRNGPTDVVKLNFFGERVRFENIDNVPF